MKNLTLHLFKNLLFLESFSYQKVASPAFQFFRSETLTFLFLLAHKIRKTRYHFKNIATTYHLVDYHSGLVQIAARALEPVYLLLLLTMPLFIYL